MVIITFKGEDLLADNKGDIWLYLAVGVGGYILYKKGILDALLNQLKLPIPPSTSIPSTPSSPVPQSPPVSSPPGSPSVPSIPFPSTGPADKFGVKKIYPDGPGSNWTMPDDPTARDDTRSNPELTGSPVRWGGKNPDGSWRMNGPQSVRWAIAQDNGFKQSQMSCCTDIVKPRGYMQDAKDWKDIEMTAYYRVIKCGSGSANGSCHIEHVMRGQRSTTSSTPNGPGGCGIGCSDNYHCNAYPAEGRLKFEKNLFHTSGYSNDISGTQKQGAIRKFDNNTWIGLKSVVYNLPNGSVKLEWYVDEAANNTWVKKHEFTDSGQWTPRGSTGNCHHVNGNPITWGGPLCAFRNDNITTMDIKWATIRSITAPGGAAQASQATIFDDYITMSDVRAYQASRVSY
jgi:hypothetical protein